MGDEERYGGRPDAAAWQRELGWRRERYIDDAPVGGSEHSQVSRKSGPRVHLGSFSGQHAARKLYRPSESLRAQGGWGEGSDLHVSRAVRYRPAEATAHWRVESNVRTCECG